MKIEKSKLLLTGMAGFALFLAIPLAANKANADEFEESTPGFLESIDMSNAVYSAEITSIERRMKLGYDVNAAYHDSKRGVEHDGKIKGNLLEIGVHLDTDRGALSLSGRISTGIDGEYNENTYSNSETQSLGYERVAYEAEGDSEGSIWGLNAEMQFYNAAWIKPIAGVFYEGMHFKTNDDYQGYRGYEYEQSHFVKDGFEARPNSAFARRTETTMHRLGFYGGASVPFNIVDKVSAETVITLSPVNFAFGSEDRSGADLTYGLGYQVDFGTSIAYRPMKDLTLLVGYNFGLSSSYSDSRDYIKDAELTFGVGYVF